MQIGERGLVVRPEHRHRDMPRADGSTGAALLKHADTAMYRAKREQTGYAFFGELAAEERIMRVAPQVPASLAKPPASVPTNLSASAMQ